MAVKFGKSDSNSVDEFPIGYRRVEGNRPQRVRRFYCSAGGCGTFEEVNDNGQIALPAEVVRKKITQRHWELGKDREHDVCPQCAERARILRRKANQQKESPMLMTVVSSTPAPEPTKITTDDRRIIFAKLNEVWAGADSGYITPWTDQAVARDLGVPLAWVAEIRSSMFGEAKDNEEIRDVLTKINGVLIEIARKTKEAETFRTEVSALVTKGNAINGALVELRRSADHLQATADRIEKAVK